MRKCSRDYKKTFLLLALILSVCSPMLASDDAEIGDPKRRLGRSNKSKDPYYPTAKSIKALLIDTENFLKNSKQDPEEHKSLVKKYKDDLNNHNDYVLLVIFKMGPSSAIAKRIENYGKSLEDIRIKLNLPEDSPKQAPGCGPCSLL
jgi:hypothetical protein